MAAIFVVYGPFLVTMALKAASTPPVCSIGIACLRTSALTASMTSAFGGWLAHSMTVHPAPMVRVEAPTGRIGEQFRLAKGYGRGRSLSCP